MNSMPRSSPTAIRLQPRLLKTGKMEASLAPIRVVVLLQCRAGKAAQLDHLVLGGAAVEESLTIGAICHHMSR